MNFEQQEHLPTLLPLRPKKVESEGASKQQMLKETLSIFQKQNSMQTEKDIRKSDFQSKSPLGGDKIPQFDQTLNKIHDKSERRDEKEKRITNNMKQKQAQISKQLIEVMMKKINGKNISQQLYPVTNETISDLIKKLDQQIADIKFQLDRKRNSLLSNNVNQHLKKQIEGAQSTIDKCLTIKQLYNDKITQRNRISSLQQKVIDLKQENLSLKMKINRGIETIENHMHNLPCEQEKALLEELNKSQIELKKEKEMRMKLENSISTMVLNFKRLYEQADTARMIVNGKLKELQEREKNITMMPINQSSYQHSDRKYKNADYFQEKKVKRVQLENSSEMNFDNSLNTLKKVSPSPVLAPFNAPTLQPSPFTDNRDNRDKKTKNRLKEQQKVVVAPFSLEDQIKKMRNNQIALSKTQYK